MAILLLMNLPYKQLSSTENKKKAELSTMTMMRKNVRISCQNDSVVKVCNYTKPCEPTSGHKQP